MQVTDRVVDGWRQRERHDDQVIVVSGLEPPATSVRDDQAPGRHGRSMLSIDDLAGLPPPSWLVEGLVPDYGLGVLFGPSGTYKSFLALDWCLCVAAGVPWHRRPVVGGHVLYVALEGGRGLSRRVAAWKAKHPDADPGPRMHFDVEPLDLLDTGHVDAVVRALTARVRRDDVGLVVVDTLARAMPTGDENSTQDMGTLIAAADALARTFTATVMIVHHTGHNGGRERGSSSLPAAVDFRLGLDRVGVRRVRLRTEKQKDFDTADDLHLTAVAAAESLVLDLVEDPAHRYDAAIIDYLTSNGPASKNEVRDNVKGRKGDVLARLDRLAADPASPVTVTGDVPPRFTVRVVPDHGNHPEPPRFPHAGTTHTRTSR